MKKFATTLILLFVLSVSAFAGEFPIGNKTCPPGQTCFAEGEIPLGNKTCARSKLVLPMTALHIRAGISENPFVKNIFDFLKTIFG